MMEIPINDCNTLHTHFLQPVMGPDSNIVKETEPHGTLSFCMVARGANQGKTVICFTVNDHLHTICYGPDCKTGGIIRHWRSLGIRIQAGKCFAGCSGYTHDMFRGVVQC